MFKNLLQCQTMMDHDVAEDGAQCAGAERVMIGDSQMMFPTSLGGKAAVGAELPDKLVAESASKRLL